LNEFLQRLRERKLVQWSLAYVASAFALIQVLDIVAQRFGWPEQIVRIVIVALSIGFFVTVVLAWYHGERGGQRVTGTELMILALLLAIGGGLLWRFAGGARGSIRGSIRDATRAGGCIADLGRRRERRGLGTGWSRFFRAHARAWRLVGAPRRAAGVGAFRDDQSGFIELARGVSLARGARR